jgi:hypothetical protein
MQALTPAPVTPAGFPAAAVAAAASEQRPQHAAQAQQAAVLADEVLSFSFDAAVANVLGGHQERVQESLALAEPMAEEVQQGVLALEQVRLPRCQASGKEGSKELEQGGGRCKDS